MVALKKSNKANNAASIARAQEKPITLHVQAEWDSAATISKRDWTEGQELLSREDKIAYYLDIASNQLDNSDLPLDVKESEILDCIGRIDGDDEEAEEARVEYILDIHKRKHPLKIAVAQTDETIDKIAIKIAPVIGADIEEGWKAQQKVRYIAAELAYHLTHTLSPDEIAAIPPWDSKRDKSTPEGSNEKFNRAYRARAGSDFGPVSWIGDLYDRLPDVGPIRLGASLAKEMAQLNPDHKSEKDLKGGRTMKHRWDELKKKRTNGVKNLTDAVRLMQQMEAINEFRLVKCEFRLDDDGKPDLQNLSPIRLNGYRDKDSAGKLLPTLELFDYDYYPVTKVNSWDLRNLPRQTATWSKVENSGKKRNPTITAIGKDKEALEELIRLGDWFSSGKSTAIGRNNSLVAAVIEMTKDRQPSNPALVAALINLDNVLTDLRPIIHAYDKIINSKEKEERMKAIEASEKMVAALHKNHA